MVHRLVVLAALLTAGIASAEPAHALYLDVLGKGGAWGLGYEYRLHPRIAAGVVGSYYVLSGDRFATLSPYVAAYPLRRGHHGWFVHLGPQLVRRTSPKLPEWSGMTTTGWDVELSSGYEYRDRFLFRLYAMATAGERVAPWLGASFGWTW